jgi:hypothetical protein
MNADRSTFQALQSRVDPIVATGDADFADRAWHTLSRVLFEYAREQIGRRNVDMFEVRMKLMRKLVNTRLNSQCM